MHLENNTAALSNEQLASREVVSHEAEYVQETLKRIDVEDIEGVLRPVYKIADRDIVFRTLNDAPNFPQGVYVAGAEYAAPLPYTITDPETWKDETADTSGIENYVTHHDTDDESNVVVVSNTPDSLLAAAAHLSQDPNKVAYFTALQQDVAQRRYELPESRVVVDHLLAALSVDEKGELRSLVDTDGWVIGLASLLGDEKATEIVDKKYEVLIADAANTKEKQRKIEDSLKLAETFGAEPIPLNELALVHSTAYPIERDKNGDIVLSTAGDKRADKYPRASLHFTVNSRVFPHAQAADAWSSDQTLIVANLQKATEHSSLKVLDGVDSWAVLNPGEKMKLPDATLVIPDKDAVTLIDQKEGEVRFASKEVYTDDEAEEVHRISMQYGVFHEDPREALKEAALKIALKAQGVPDEYYDSPSQSGHGMSSGYLARRVQATAAAHGVTSGTHFNYPESHAEYGVNGRVRAFADATRVQSAYGGAVENDPRTLFSNASLEMRRMMFANGYYATRDSHVKELEQPSGTLIL